MVFVEYLCISVISVRHKKSFGGGGRGEKLNNAKGKESFRKY